MASIPLLPLGLPKVSVWTDYGQVGKGASLARYVLGENGSEYIMKGPTLTPDHRYVAANEVIAARFAQQLGLPLLDCCVLEMTGDLFFGSSWMDKGTFYPAITEDILSRCANAGRVYDLVAFDAWLLNTDRHHENLIARRRRSSSGNETNLLVLNDHSHLLIPPQQDPTFLTARVDFPPSQCVALDFVRSRIIDAPALSAAVATIEALPNDAIEAVVNSVPEAFIRSNVDRSPISQYLMDRRDRLRNLFRAHVGGFPNLVGGSI